ncbi:hypothetical protein BC941DRAFT_466835 [Chlamydoabsidia padenii]|nr:hypothetical protein BC941DRAFT_466835 [Chlamydoabsidia padenii]
MSSKRSHLLVPSRSELDTNTGRQRQSKRDEAIRQKFERELSKKRTSTMQRQQQQYRKIAGTVSALRPAQALTVKETMLVIEASQLMAAKRSDCVLVVDDDDHLSGIFTAKDIAYRVVAEDDMDAKSTTVANIMTPNPMCVTASTSAQDALNLMVSRGFRHLPVCNDEGDIFGLLDITKCLYEALDKMERAYGSSRKLYDALEGVEREWAGNPVQLVQYMEVLRDRMSCPDMTTVMERGAVEVNYKINVREIAKMMKKAHTTAVLVMKHHRLAGIFTTKDIVLRVIAAGLNPENCSVVRVMTPEPDCAEPTTTVLEALKRMNDGHYLNLPILDNGHVVGIVDVLKLTYATLEQMNSIQGNDGEGPMWSRFWDSFGGVESESHTSSDHNGSHSTSRNRPVSSHIISPEPSTSMSHLQNLTEIEPNESASVVNDNDETSSVSTNTKQDNNAFTFKFTSLGGKTHRFSFNSNSYALLLETVRQKVMGEHVQFGSTFSDSATSSSTIGNNADTAYDGIEWLSISYMDDENDLVLISSDADVQEAVNLARKMAQTRVKLHVHDTKAIPSILNTDNPSSPIKTDPPACSRPGLESLTDSDEEDQVTLKKRKKTRSPAGANQDFLLPAAIVFLGVAIIGVFAYSHISRSR